MTIKKHRKLKAQVFDLLKNQPLTREDDRELVALYWQIEQPMLFAFRPAEAVLRAYINAELTSVESITRTRRQVQKEHPELGRWGKQVLTNFPAP
jgi:hypothetical protein